jgi:hypothetical protein
MQALAKTVFLALLAALLAFLAACGSDPKEGPLGDPPDWATLRACEVDGDCIVVEVSCCGCPYGAVNRSYLEQVDLIEPGDCDQLGCAIEACQGGEAQCLNGACTYFPPEMLYN